MAEKGKEKRITRRSPLEGRVHISWQDERGIFKTSQVRGIDIGETGMLVEYQEPIALRTSVNVRAERYNLSTACSVRYCRANGPKYKIGLEFIGGFRWRPPARTGAGSPAPSGQA